MLTFLNCKPVHGNNNNDDDEFMSAFACLYMPFINFKYKSSCTLFSQFHFFEFLS